MLINKLKIVIVFISLVITSCNSKKEDSNKNNSDETSYSTFDSWQEGYLDIHHINTGSGDTCFMILPDGTTILFDAGKIDKDGFEKKYAPLKATSLKPNDSLSAAQWIALYIERMIPKDKKNVIDYAIVSHFHGDHYGSLVELGKIIAIEKIIDRNYPNYDFPVHLETYLIDDEIFQDYQNFIKEKEMLVEPLKIGSNSQIELQNDKDKYPTFEIRNIKSNGTIWTGIKEETFEYFSAEDMTNYYKGKYNENPLSLAIKISYGNFDYFTGGDNTGLQGFGLPDWFDVETPMAKAVGKVEVITLNHHGNRDATNAFFLKILDPKVIVQQSWCSDHPGQEVFQRLIYKDNKADERDIFATSIHDETQVTYGPWFKDNYKSMRGHIVVRVYPNGDFYEVFVLSDDTAEIVVKEKYGLYKTK